MTYVKTAFLSGAILVALNGSVFAQSAFADSSPLFQASFPMRMVALSDRAIFSYADAFDRPEYLPCDPLPTLEAAELPTIRVVSKSRRHSSAIATALTPPGTMQVSGEAGVFYGRSSGKCGREISHEFIVGELGNDRFSITVGASHEEISGRTSRFGR